MLFGKKMKIFLFLKDTVKMIRLKDTIPADEKPVKVIVKKSAIRKAVRTKNNKKIKITLKKVAGC